MAGAVLFADVVKSQEATFTPVAKAQVAKVDSDLGLVFGWAIISEENGAPYYDTQGDWIPSDVMLDAVTKFMSDARVAKDMHSGEQIGTIVHSLPLTFDIAKSLGIETARSGWIVAMRPCDDVLKQFRSGERTGFSIGGNCKYELMGDD